MRLGTYDVEQTLGAGGMSSVWLARGEHGLVVLKRQINPDDDDRLRDEARVGLRLNHPSVVRTLDLFEHQGRPILVLEYVAGASLVALRKKGPMAPAAVCRVGADVAEGLAALHDAVDDDGRRLRILHRDVSPSNVIVTPLGQARLIDLGIANQADGWEERSSEKTRTGDLRGTIRYLAPELFDAKKHTAKTDLWALGVCLFEAALGRQAVVGSEATILAAVVRGTLLALAPGEALPPPLERVIRRLCAPENERLDSALDAVRALREAERAFGDGRVHASHAVYAVANVDVRSVAADDAADLASSFNDDVANPFARFAATTYCGHSDDDLFGDGAMFSTGALETAATPAREAGSLMHAHEPRSIVPAPVTAVMVDPSHSQSPLSISTAPTAPIAPAPGPSSSSSSSFRAVPRSSPGELPANNDSWSLPQPVTGGDDPSTTMPNAPAPRDGLASATDENEPAPAVVGQLIDSGVGTDVDGAPVSSASASALPSSSAASSSSAAAAAAGDVPVTDHGDLHELQKNAVGSVVPYAIAAAVAVVIVIVIVVLAH